MFEFFPQDQNIIIHHFDENGVYLSSNETMIEANTGLPALSTDIDLPVLGNDEIAVFSDDEWSVKTDNRGKTAYAKNRRDSDYQITNFDDIPDTHTLSEPAEFDSWIDGSWQYDIEQKRPGKTLIERRWRDTELTQVLSRIDQYEKDQNYPAELRTSPIKSEADFLKLLNDRKLLSDYPSSENFPFGKRPTLSGLAV